MMKCWKTKAPKLMIGVLAGFLVLGAASAQADGEGFKNCAKGSRYDLPSCVKIADGTGHGKHKWNLRNECDKGVAVRVEMSNGTTHHKHVELHAGWGGEVKGGSEVVKSMHCCNDHQTGGVFGACKDLKLLPTCGGHQRADLPDCVSCEFKNGWTAHNTWNCHNKCDKAVKLNMQQSRASAKTHKTHIVASKETWKGRTGDWIDHFKCCTDVSKNDFMCAKKQSD